MSVITRNTTNLNQNLFSGIWLKWQNLTISERVVCLNIVFIPLWWIAGLYRYMAFFFLIAICIYQQRNYGKIKLKKPNAAVSLFLAFCCYRCFGFLIYCLSNSTFSPTQTLRVFLTWIPTAFILWFVQINNIKVRIEPVAWAFSVLVVQMIVFWVIGQLILGGKSYIYPRTLFSFLSGNVEGDYQNGNGLGNYLILYSPHDVSIPGSARWRFFFITPELSAVVVSYICLVALDLKKRYWSLLLFIGGFFLILVSGTRSVWLVLPLLIIFRYSFAVGKVHGFHLPLATLAILSFAIAVLPSVTDFLQDFLTQSTSSLGDFRANSTDIRSDIYAQTLEEIPNKLFFGHWISGESVRTGNHIARVGTHSFILGNLLYKLGLIGTWIFSFFWIFLAAWCYQTRQRRPLSSYFLFILYTLLSTTMEFGEMPALMTLLLAVIVRHSDQKVFRGAKNV